VNPKKYLSKFILKHIKIKLLKSKDRGKKTVESKQRKIMGYLKWKNYWVLVAHACYPSNSGGRDQEDHGSKPAQANSS
jgi:hypothetical protein